MEQFSNSLIIRKGDVFEGKDYADMINGIFGTKYKFYMRSSLNMKKFGLNDHIAWFVFINGKVHGYENWSWLNLISHEGVIVEQCISDKDNKFEKDTQSLPNYRLVFQRDPDNDGSKYKCKFLGVCEKKEVNLNQKYRTHCIVDDEVCIIR